MPKDEIQKLLKLQECDTEKLEAEMRLKHIPIEVKQCQDKIKAQQDILQAARQKCKEMEVKRAEMKTERQSKEEKIVKYKTQQLQVKKNNEYQALTLEIQSMEEKLGSDEELELVLLMEIDKAHEQFALVEKEVNKEIKFLEEKLSKLKEQEAKIKQDIGSIITAVEQATALVDKKYLKAYETVKTRFKKPPFVIPIIDKKVNGLLVSNEVESRARKGEEIVVCDNTGRIVYLP
jgi:uncharacterized protein